jgi:hypothetical protein
MAASQPLVVHMVMLNCWEQRGAPHEPKLHDSSMNIKRKCKKLFTYNSAKMLQMTLSLSIDATC